MGDRAVDTIIRPAAVLSVAAATQILDGLARSDVANGGLWNASSTVWQRYDVPWSGAGGMRGAAVVVGTIAVVYDSPRAHEITIYKASVTDAGVDRGWTTERLCDDALAWAGLTLASCPRASLATPPRFDPFHADADDSARSALLAPEGTRVSHDGDDLFGTRGTS